MTWVAVAVVGTGLVTAVVSSKATKDAANTAANAQITSGDKSVDEIRRQFDAVQGLMKPYVDAGGDTMKQQLDLLGTNGDDAYAKAIAGIEKSPQMDAITKAGEAGILANASATGGLRGGNTQGALAQFRPQVLSQLINERFNKLGGITALGQASAAGQAAAGQNAGAQISDIYGQQGAASAGAALAGGRADANMYGQIGSSISTLGYLKLLKGF